MIKVDHLKIVRRRPQSLVESQYQLSGNYKMCESVYGGRQGELNGTGTNTLVLTKNRIYKRYISSSVPMGDVPKQPLVSQANCLTCRRLRKKVSTLDQCLIIILLKPPSCARGLATMALAMNVIDFVLSASRLRSTVLFGIGYAGFSQVLPYACLTEASVES